MLGLLTSSDNGLALLLSITGDIERTDVNDLSNTACTSDIVCTDNIQHEDIEVKAKSLNMEVWIRNICMNNAHDSVRIKVDKLSFIINHRNTHMKHAYRYVQ